MTSRRQGVIGGLDSTRMHSSNLRRGGGRSWRGRISEWEVHGSAQKVEQLFVEIGIGAANERV